MHNKQYSHTVLKTITKVRCCTNKACTFDKHNNFKHITTLSVRKEKIQDNSCTRILGQDYQSSKETLANKVSKQ